MGLNKPAQKSQNPVITWRKASFLGRGVEIQSNEIMIAGATRMQIQCVSLLYEQNYETVTTICAGSTE